MPGVRRSRAVSPFYNWNFVQARLLIEAAPFPFSGSDAVWFADSRAPNDRSARNGQFDHQDRSHFFYKHPPPVCETRFVTFRGCEPDAAMRYLDADETISNESTAACANPDCRRTSRALIQKALSTI